jgi:hypothetical protein
MKTKFFCTYYVTKDITDITLWYLTLNLDNIIWLILTIVENPSYIIFVTFILTLEFIFIVKVKGFISYHLYSSEGYSAVLTIK